MVEPILSYYDLSPDVTAFSSTRHGGFSTGAYASFNINEYCGDSSESIRKNKEILCRKLGISPSRLIMPHQSHGTKTKVIDEDFLAMDSDAKHECLEGVDALITVERQVCIGVSTADCLPLLFYDKRNRVAAAIHAGWRGTCSRISSHVAELLNKLYGTCFSELRVAFGPCISLEDYEIKDDVYQRFADAGFDMKTIVAQKESKLYLDIREANKQTLKLIGVTLDNCIFTKYNTYQYPDAFFSVRRQSANTGRTYSGIILR